MKSRSSVIVLALLAILTVAAYLPVILHGNFIWDDDQYITENMTIKQPDGLYAVWLEPGKTPQYYPVVFTSFFFETRLYGDNPRGFIVLNVILHAGSVFLIYLLLNKLKIPGALLAAALFAVHPMTVESVAWITERKNTFACFFTLAAALVYLSYLPTGGEKPKTKYTAYAGATLLFVLALLSKSVSCSLPAVLLVILWWQQKKFPWKDLLWLLPWFALGLIAGLHTAYLERTHVGADGPEFAFSILDRVLIIGRTWWFYLGKFVWPHPLSFFYPRWHVNPQQLWQFAFPVGAVAVILALVLLRKKLGYAPLVVIVLYSLIIFPALGFFNIYPFRYSFVADHFAYLALIPLAAGVAALISRVLPRLSFKPAYAIASALLLAALMPLSWNRAYAYSGLIPLWKETLRVNPESQAVWSLLGAAYLRNQQFEQARDALLVAYHMPPRDPDVAGMLANACVGLGRLQEADAYAQEILQAKPQAPGALLTMGVVRQQQKRIPEAISYYLRSYQASPGNGSAVFNAGVLLAEMGLFDKAADCFTIATQVNPRWAHAWDYLGRCLAMQGKLPEAIASFERACELDDKPDYRQDLDRARADMAARQKAAPMTQPGRP